MMERQKIAVRLLALWLLTALLVACNGVPSVPINPPGPYPIYAGGFDFPIAPEHQSHIKGLKAFGIVPWGNEAVHNGIDIIPDYTSSTTPNEIRIVAPATGDIVAVEEIVNPNVNLKWMLVVIRVSDRILITLSFEPQTDDPVLWQEQKDRILVQGPNHMTQQINKGDTVGYLQIPPRGQAKAYPHIDYRILIKPQAMTPQELWEQQDLIGHNCWSRLPTFVCPLSYSTPEARQIFQDIIALPDDPAEPLCDCACKGGITVCLTPFDESICGAGCVD